MIAKESGQHFDPAIVEAFDGLDLRGVAFVSGATAVVSGTTLAVTDGGKVYDFKLGGTIGASYHVTSDGHGGTLVYDPPLAHVGRGPGVRPCVLAPDGPRDANLRRTDRRLRR